MHSSGFLIAALTFGVIWGICGFKIGKGRGRPGLGAVLGFLIGLVGLLILVIIPRTPKAKARHEAAKAAWQQPPTGLRPPGSPPSWEATSQAPRQAGDAAP
jgi:hypothetical protein